MMKSGTGPTSIDHRDRDLHRSFGNTSQQQFPAEFFADPWPELMPNQNIEDSAFVPPVAAMPNGCTNESTASISTTLARGLTVYRPDTIEKITHADALGGYDIRQSLLAGVKLGWFKNFYQVTAAGILDWFDAFRLAQIAGLPENKSLSIGTPWFPSWEAAIEGQLIRRENDGSYTFMTNPKGPQIIMPMPTDSELAAIRKDPYAFGWHNHVFDGWTQKFGPLVYRDKSWQGPNIGEGGFVYFPREVVNVMMSIKGSVAFVGTMQTPQNIITVDVTAVQWIVSFIQTLIAKAYGAIRKTA